MNLIGVFKCDNRLEIFEREANIKIKSKSVKVGKLTKAQVEEIAKTKMLDLNCTSLESAMSMVAGTARSMGVTVEE